MHTYGYCHGVNIAGRLGIVIRMLGCKSLLGIEYMKAKILGAFLWGDPSSDQ